jgi:hypothetical protein
MTIPTMVYRAATADTPDARKIDVNGTAVEWQIVDLEDGAAPPAGWSASHLDLAPAPAKKSKKTAPVEAPDGNSD